MPQNNLFQSLRPFTEYAGRKWPVHPDVICQIICDLTAHRPQLVKMNNLFAIAGPNKKWNSYPTPVHGIDAGMQILTNNPQFIANKVGTLKANPKLQLLKIRQILAIKPI